MIIDVSIFFSAWSIRFQKNLSSVVCSITIRDYLRFSFASKSIAIWIAWSMTAFHGEHYIKNAKFRVMKSSTGCWDSQLRDSSFLDSSYSPGIRPSTIQAKTKVCWPDQENSNVVDPIDNSSFPCQLCVAYTLFYNPNIYYPVRWIFQAPLLRAEECERFLRIAQAAARRNYLEALRTDNSSELLADPIGWHKSRYAIYTTTDLHFIVDQFSKEDITG